METCVFRIRVIDLWVALKSCDWAHEPRSYQSFSTVPSLLHTSKEAREVGLRHYSLEFGREIRIGNSNLAKPIAKGWSKITIPPKIYVNWDVDIICPISHCSIHSKLQDAMKMNGLVNAISTGGFPIRRLALELRWLHRWGEQSLRNLPLTQLVLYKMRDDFKGCTLSTQNSMTVELVEPVDLKKDWERGLLTYLDEDNGREVQARGEFERFINDLQNKRGDGRVPAGWEAPSAEIRRLEMKLLR